MSKKTKSVAEHAPEHCTPLRREVATPTATQLILAAQGNTKSQLSPLTPAAHDELAKVLAYNDASPRQQRVRIGDCITMLQGHGWTGTSPTGLNALCSRLFGRRTYGTK